MPRLRKALQRLTLTAVATVLGLLLAEAGLRLVAPQQLVSLRPDVWHPDDGLGWKRAADLDTRINTGAREVRLLTDGEGHRIAALPRPEPARRVLALGDSFVAGLQVEARESLTERLADLLSDRLGEPTAVVNAAVSGWGPEQYLEAARRELSRASYDLVVVFLFVGNDTLLEARGPLSPRPPFPRRTLRLPRALSRYEFVDSLAYPVNDALEKRSHLYVAGRRALRHPLMRSGLSAAQLPRVFLDGDPESDRWEVTAHVCRAIADVARDAGAPSLFLLLPGVYQVVPREGELFVRNAGLREADVSFRFANDQLLLALRKHALVASDSTPTLRRAARDGDPLFGTLDSHFTARGHEVAAAYAAGQVVALLRFLEALSATGRVSPAEEP